MEMEKKLIEGGNSRFGEDYLHTLVTISALTDRYNNLD